MKKILILINMMILLLSVEAFGISNLTDVKTEDWYYKNLQELVLKDIVSGYPDGTFKPDNTLKFEEFIKMLVVTVEEELEEQKEGQEWYQIYIDEAIESKYITEQQKSVIGQNINRQAMAEILYNVLTKKEEIKVYTDEELKYFSDKLTDIKETDIKVLTISGRGVISGYPDGTFKPAGTLTRAEAVAVISRVINPELRNPVKIVRRDANGIIDANDLDQIPIMETEFDEIANYTRTDIHDRITYKAEGLIKADVSMFPIKYGGLIITGIEKLPAEKAPYYGDTSIAWNNTGSINKLDAIVIHAYAIEKTDDNNNTIGYNPTSALRGAFVNESGKVYSQIAATVSKSYGGDKVYQKTKEMFPDYAIGESPMVELNKQFTTMIVANEGFELENIDKIILMDIRGTYSETSTNNILEIDSKDVKEVK